LPDASAGKGSRILGPMLQNLLREGAGLVTDTEFGFVGSAVGLTVALDDVENLLEALAQLRTSR